MSTHKAFTTDPEKWWDPKGPFWTLHAINPLRTHFINQQITAQSIGLDVGCGGGILTESLSKNHQMTGIDTDHNLINVAKDRKLQQTIRYRACSINELLPEYSNHYDFITSLEMLEHCPNPQEVLTEIVKLLKPNGYLFLSTINRNILSFLGAIVMAEHVLRIVPKHTHHYEHFIKPEELIEWGQNLNLRLINLQGIHYHPLSKSFSIGADHSINYIACFQNG